MDPPLLLYLNQKEIHTKRDYRPLFLMHTDEKIHNKILKKQIQEQIKMVIHSAWSR